MNDQTHGTEAVPDPPGPTSAPPHTPSVHAEPLAEAGSPRARGVDSMLAPQPKKHPKARIAAIAHVGMAVALIAAVIAVASKGAAPALDMAEFAPAGKQSLEAPPATDGGISSSGAGSSSRRSTTTSTAPTSTGTDGDGRTSGPGTTTVLRARQCVGSPPRQTADPQSPACMVGVYEGENGGATWKGVTANEIRVAVPGLSTDPKSIDHQAMVAMFEHFNQRFELYGRKLVPVPMNGSASDAAGSRALGAEIGGMGVFATVTGYMERWSYAKVGLGQELARQKVLMVMNNRTTWWSDAGVFDASHPYIWSVFPSAEQSQRALGAIGCSLAGKPAKHTKDRDLMGKTRKFGILTAGNQTGPSVKALVQAMTACTGDAPAVLDWASGRDTSTAMSTGLTKMADSGVTTVFCTCERGIVREALYYGHSVNFDPEWISPPMTATGGDEQNMQSEARSGNPVPIQAQTGPRLIPIQARPWFSAIIEQNEKLLSGAEAANNGAWVVADQIYDQLLVLASGIQGAGPNLSPESFAQALMTTQFPNPGAGQAPFWQAGVGFGPGDHSFYSDFAIGWWSPTATGLDPYAYSGTGSYCYVGTGTRFRTDTVPANLDNLLYNADLPCR